MAPLDFQLEVQALARQYGRWVETTADPDQVGRFWSDMSTCGDWNPNVSTVSNLAREAESSQDRHI